MGVPYHPEVGQPADTATTFVLEFPVKAPERAVTRNDIAALEQLEYWKMLKECYTEHNPSVTVIYCMSPNNVARSFHIKVGEEFAYCHRGVIHSACIILS